jgi:hypothetical protein
LRAAVKPISYRLRLLGFRSGPYSVVPIDSAFAG